MLADVLVLALLASQDAAAPAAAAPAASAPAAPALRFARPRLLGSGNAPAPRLPFVADLDGDSFGDIVSVDPQSGVVDVALSVRGGKFIAPANAAKDLGQGLVDASVRVGANGRAEVVVVRADGTRKVVSWGDDGAWQVKDAEPVAAPAAPIAATENANAASTITPTLRADFDGDGVLDQLTGSSLALATDPGRPIAVKELEALPSGAVVVAGDLNGDHRADLVVFRRDGEYRTGADVLGYLACKDGDADADADGLDVAAETKAGSDPFDADTDHDGLLDGFEVKGEGALDFPALGASPVHKDCFVYVQRYFETDGALCAREVARVVKTWSEMGNKNPDGSTGIALHPVWLQPLPPGTPGRAWWDLGNEYLPKTARGLAHYMELNNGGGGQAAELGDMGGCGTGALWACFLHEFGHQVGLSHSGGALPLMCPTYTSLMSYAFSYGFEDDGNKIHYSRGELASLVLNETKLSERVEMPFAKLAYLAKGPYRFNVKADDGAPGVPGVTWVDWNRNGAFDTGTVRADVTDVYGAGCATRFGGMGKTTVAPVLVEHAGQLVLLTVTREKQLTRRRVLGKEKFEDAAAVRSVAPGTVAGDPAAVSDGTRVFLFVPTTEGVSVLVAPTPDALDTATPAVLPESKGLAVSATLVAGRPLLLLWKDADSPVRALFADDAGGLQPCGDFGALRSDMAPGAVEDPTTHELAVGVCATTKDEKGEHHKWVVSRFKKSDDGATWLATTSSVVGGETSGWCGNSRPMLLVESGPTAAAAGRLHFIGRGFTSPIDANGCFFEAITIGDKTTNDGWRLRRWIDEWTTTKSPVGACFFESDLAIAYRWFGNVHGDEDEDVHVLLGCFGIDPSDMHDFDDVSAIADVGLERSILWRDAAAR